MYSLNLALLNARQLALGFQTSKNGSAGAKHALDWRAWLIREYAPHPNCFTVSNLVALGRTVSAYVL